MHRSGGGGRLSWLESGPRAFKALCSLDLSSRATCDWLHVGIHLRPLRLGAVGVRLHRPSASRGGGWPVAARLDGVCSSPSKSPLSYARRNRRASSPGVRGWVERHSSRLGSRFASRAAITHRVCAWRRPAGSSSGRISMCSLNEGRCFPQSGQRYVAGFRFCAGRTVHQRGFVSLLSLTPSIRSPREASWVTEDGGPWPN